MTRALLRVALGATSFALAASCQEPLPQASACYDIPAGGCPRTGAEVCNDTACEKVYACVDGQWSFVAACGPRDAGSARDRETLDAPPPREASIDAPPGAYGGPGCPALDVPDCALGTALGCSQGCCGCEDLFVCASGGWTLWGRCRAGELTPE